MSKAIELIVEGYVRLNDRTSLERLQAHRKGLLADLQGRSGFDFSSTIRVIEDELSIIGAALGQLEQPTG